MGFLDVLFSIKPKKNNDKKWFDVLGVLLDKQKSNNKTSEYYYLYNYCACVYYENFNAGKGKPLRDHYKFFEEIEVLGEINNYQTALNNLLPSGLKQNFNTALNLYKQNKTKGWIKTRELLYNVDRYYINSSEDEKQKVKELLFDCYKKLSSNA